MSTMEIVKIGNDMFYEDSLKQEYTKVNNSDIMVTFDELQQIEDCTNNWDNQQENCRDCTISHICYAIEC